MPLVQGGDPAGATDEDQVTIACTCNGDVAHVLNVVVDWAKPTPGGFTSRCVAYSIDQAPDGQCRVTLKFAPCGGGV